MTQQQYSLLVGGNGGIGLALLQHWLAAETDSFFFASFRRTPGPQLQSLAQQYPQRLHLLSLDLSDEHSLHNLTLALSAAGCTRLRRLICCAGVLQDDRASPEKRLAMLNADALQHYFMVNSIGPMVLAKHLQPWLKHNEPAVFACLSAKMGSIGDNALGGWYGYRASKAALNMLLKTLAIEWRRSLRNVIVASVHPGTTDSPLSQPFQHNIPAERLYSPQQTAQRLAKVFAELRPQDSGAFFNWDGSRLPW